MAGKRPNILIYSGPGATPHSIRQATWSLRRLCTPQHAVLPITPNQLLNEPWPASCALLVFPGGADLGYCRVLNGEGNRRIKRYVEAGGGYLGLCAGGYYGSSKCEWEVGRKGWEVVGNRELSFFPGICRGLAFPGFVYQSEAGAKAVDLSLSDALTGEGLQGFKSYYNGGGVFVDAQKFEDEGVEVIASFKDELAVDPGEGKAAVVCCRVGEGRAILTGPHPEFSGENLNHDQPGNPSYPALVDALLKDDEHRIAFMKVCLRKLGVNVSTSKESVPSLSRLHLSAAEPFDVAEIVHSWHESGLVTRSEDGLEYINGENDTFRMLEADTWDLASVKQAVADVLPEALKDAVSSAAEKASSLVSAGSEEKGKQTESEPLTLPDRTPDYDAQLKYLLPHQSSHPDYKETPYFHHTAFFASLQTRHASHASESPGTFGKHLLYGEVVTSTSTLLEKNISLLATLPIGTTATANTQVSGRGRGSNVWVSPPGSLMFSTVLRHPLALLSTAPVVFVQYLAALAVVQGIRTYGPGGYASLPVKLKWPNDIYALDPRAPAPAKDTPVHQRPYVKIGGILVNSSYAGGDYTLVVGVGLNLSNPSPSNTSLADLCGAASLPTPGLEDLLASILVQFEELYTRFSRAGFDERFERMYYEQWLHMGQEVSLELEGEGKVKGSVKGITRDWGSLIVEEVREGPIARLGGGKRYEVRSDGNSFDFFRGLVGKKQS